MFTFVCQYLIKRVYNFCSNTLCLLSSTRVLQAGKITVNDLNKVMTQETELKQNFGEIHCVKNNLSLS